MYIMCMVYILDISIRNPKSKTVLIFLLTKDNKPISKISIYFDTSRILFKSEMTMNYKYSITSKYNYCANISNFIWPQESRSMDIPHPVPQYVIIYPPVQLVSQNTHPALLELLILPGMILKSP